jgi:hypothetical protein
MSNNMTITRFENEEKMKNWAKRTGMKFGTYCVESEEGYQTFADDLRKAGMAVVECLNFSHDKSALVAFHRP